MATDDCLLGQRHISGSDPGNLLQGQWPQPASKDALEVDEEVHNLWWCEVDGTFFQQRRVFAKTIPEDPQRRDVDDSNAPAVSIHYLRWRCGA